MEKTILIGSGNQKFSLKAQRGLFFFAGAIFVAQGFFYLITGMGWPMLSIPLSILIILGGAYHFFMGIAISSERSKYSPKVKLSDDEIVFRLEPFKANIVIQWADIRSISLMSYSLAFELAESRKVIKYRTSGEISIEIKEAIRDFAEQKGVIVDGS